MAGARGDFFAVDRRIWAKVCALEMNAAAAYLVLARGTGPDNRTTAWSAQAIERYTSISRGRAKRALATLSNAGVVRGLRGGTRPQYELVPWAELNGQRAPSRRPMTERQRAVFDLVEAGGQPTGPDKGAAYALARKGWLTKDAGGLFRVAPEPDTAPDWIWLPNELVTGAVSEVAPVELVRQTQDVMTLRLLVDLYHAQNLREDGGVGREFTWQEFERCEVGRQAEFTVWGFQHKSTWVSWRGLTECHRRDEADLTDEERAAGATPGVDFFRRQDQLADLGLIEWVPHLVESGDAGAEIIHPLGTGKSDSLEDRLGVAAGQAGAALLTDRQRERAEDNGLWLVPVPRHIANVQVVGIARLRYRPRTRMTAAWWADLQEKGGSYIRRYAELAGTNACKISVFG